MIRPLYLVVSITELERQVPETVTRRCSVKQLFLKALLNLQENICAGVSYLVRCRLLDYNLIKKGLHHRYFFILQSFPE